MKARGHYGGVLYIGAVFVLWFGLLYGTVATAIMLPFARVPDWDQHISDKVLSHREETHTLAFVVGVAFVAANTSAFPVYAVQELVVEFGFINRPLISAMDVWLFIGLAVGAALLSHIMVDILTKGGGYKIKPLYPLSSWTIALGFCKSDDAEWNVALFSGGMTAFVAAYIHELIYSVEILNHLV